jgi:hypothetical protein
MNALFKYRGTNCSQVAAKMGMNRQVLFRMIKNNTLKLSTLFEILDLLDLKMDFRDGGKSISLRPVSCERFKKKIKGVVYDTDKMFAEQRTETDEIVAELCYEPIQKKYVIVRYRKDGEKDKKYPSMELV